jgi:hypothetical protein
MQLIAANPQKYPISSSLKLRLLLGIRRAEPRSALNAKVSPLQIHGTIKICCESGSLTLLPGA